MHACVYCINLMFCLKYQWPWCPAYWPRCPLIIFKSQGQLALPSNCPNSRPEKVKVWFYIALYPVRWTAQSAVHFPPLADLFIPTPFSASLGSILAMQQLRNDYSLTFPPLSTARYSFIQLSRLRRREVKENAQTSKR